MNYRLALPLLLFALLSPLAACDLDSSPGGNSISGTVTAPAQGSVVNTRIVACFEGDCRNEIQGATAYVDAFGNYTLTNLAAGSYTIFAWNDTNGTAFIDDSDYYGAYGNLQNPTPVTPPASNINIIMALQDSSATPPPTGNGNSISGTVSAPAEGDIANTLVGVCPVNDTQCINGVGIRIEQPGPSAAYSIGNLPAGQYLVIATQDVDGDEKPDFLGSYPSVASRSPVTAPASGIDVQLEPVTPSSVNASGLDKLELNESNLDEVWGLPQ